mmetsp:Transcript_11157/g.31605  ORF Transcript_11157/g.31605 Transcript_11157/m.31605 type:complete len:561 (-) Transcript_11157:2392-4074(-)
MVSEDDDESFLPGGDSGAVLSLAAARRLAAAYGKKCALPGADLQTATLRVAVLAAPVLPVGKADSPPSGKGAAWDIYSEAGASAQTLREMCLPSGSVVRLQPRVLGAHSLPAEAQLPRLARLMAMPTAQEGCIHLSPSLAHNMGLRPCMAPLLASGDVPVGVGVEQVEVQRAEGGVEPSPAVSEEQPLGPPVAVPLARSISVAEVRRPPEGSLPDGQGEARKEGRDQALVDGLQRHFRELRRLVAPGDVLGVWVDRQDGSLELLQGLFGQRGMEPVPPAKDFVLFAVTHMEPPCCAVMDPEETALTLGGSCAAAIPVGLQGYAELDEERVAIRREGEPEEACDLALGVDAHAAWSDVPISRQVGPLLPTWRLAARILAPATHPAAAGFRLRVSVLLHGPAGSGRRCASQAAAAALGLHVVQRSAAELRGGSDSAGDSAKLKEAFAAAAEHAPSILLLTNLEALTASGSQTHQTPDGLVRRLATSLSAEIADGCGCSSPQQRATPEGSLCAGGGKAPEAHRLVLLVACADTVDTVPSIVRRCFTHEAHPPPLLPPVHARLS